MPFRILRHLFTALLLGLAPTLLRAEAEPTEAQSFLEYTALGDAPARTGYAIGALGKDLILVGGTETATGSVATDVLRWNDANKAWDSVGQLPEARTGGALVNAKPGLLWVGGSVNGQALAKVTTLAIVNGQVSLTELTPLPVAMERPSATVMGKHLYVAGNAGGENQFLRLEVDPLSKTWETLPVWSSEARIAPDLATSQDVVYLFGGTNAEGQVLTEAYRYHARKGWSAITSPPALSKATAAVGIGDSHVFVFSGGSEEILAYHTFTDTWITAGRWPSAAPSAPKVAVIDGKVISASAEGLSSINILAAETHYSWIDHVVVALYLVAMVAMGAYFVRREKSSKDYFRGGRRIPWWASGMSLFASAASAISIMAMPGKSYSTDWTFFAISICSVIVMPVSMFVIAPIVRKLNIATAFEYLELRFGLAARLMGSLIFIFNQVAARMGPVMLLPAIAMSTVTGIDVWIWIIVMGTVSTTYTFLGGLTAVIWTDTVQGSIMFLTVFGCLLLIIFRLDMPFSEMWSTLQAYDKFHTIDWEMDATYPTIWLVLIGTLFLTLMGLGDQTYVQRVQATPTLKDAQKAIATQMGVAVPMNVVLFGLGTALFLFYRNNPEQLSPVMKTDGVFPLFAAQQLPPGVSGLVIAALLAAAISTISGSTCSVANLGADDFFRRFNRGASDKQVVFVGRILTGVVGAIGTCVAIVLSMVKTNSVWDMALIITGVITSSLVGFYGLGLLTKRANEIGAITGVIAGSAVIFWVRTGTPINFWLYQLIGSVVTLIVGYSVSLLFPKPTRTDGLTIYTLREQHAQD